MGDASFKTLLFGSLNLAMFIAVYLYGRKAHPQLALWLCAGTCLVMVIVTYYYQTFIVLTFILSFVFMAILRKSDQREGLRQLFADNKIYATKTYLSEALEVLGDKKWAYSNGSLFTEPGKKITYSVWQGSTSHRVSSGEYVRTTTYTYYLAFIFPPGSASDAFKQKARAAADRSHYTRTQRIKFLFSPDTETPDLVTTAKDGSFIIRYTTIRDVAHYARRIAWLKENINPTRQAVTSPTFGLN
jgi:hypothetical protein